MFKIDYEQIVSYGVDYLNAMADMYAGRVKMGLKKGDIYDGLIKTRLTDSERDLNEICEVHYKCLNQLYTIQDVLGIGWDKIVSVARIYIAYGERTGWEKALNGEQCRALLEMS